MPIVDPPKLEGFSPRMMELASTRAPWHRRLWRCGTMELAREFLTDSIRPGIRPAAITDGRKHLMQSLQTDHGIADHGRCIADVAKAITTDTDDTSHSWIMLRHHIDEMQSSYLTNWAAVVQTPSTNPPVDTEGAARRVTAHLLGAGMHKNSLYSWLNSAQSDPEPISLSDFLLEADRRLSAPEKTYTFCVPVDKRPTFSAEAAASPDWMTSTETAAWKKTHAPEAQSVRHQGSFLIRTQARDVNAAAENARQVISYMGIKFQLGTRNALRVCPLMWSQEKRSDFPTQSTNRLISVTSFERLDRLHDLTIADYLANTLSLVEPLRTGAPHIAVISGWSAIESLLVGPSDPDDIVAARRFSLIIAASLMRAEFTYLAKTYANENQGPTANAINASTENLDRAKIFQQLLLEAPSLQFADPTDRLALVRVRPALRNPRQEITKVADILTREFTRLYRKRNMVVHGGQIHGANLHSISDTLTPLIGAGIDRIVHAELKFGVSPIRLSALAEVRTDYLKPATTTASGGLLDLLEH